MMKSIAAVAAIAFASTALATQGAPATQQPAATPDAAKQVCKYVVTPARGQDPYQLCMTKAEWKLTEARIGSDPNRIECHYETDGSSRLRSRKICQPASAWDQQRRDARQTVEHIQMGACMTSGPC